MKNEQQLLDAGLFDLGSRDSNYKAYDVTTSWSDNADSITSAHTILITNSPSIFLPTLMHIELNLPWKTKEHGYNQTLTPGFSYHTIQFSNKKFIDPFAELQDYLKMNTTPGVWYKKIVIINHDWQHDQTKQLINDQDINTTLDQLSAIRENQIKDIQKKLRKERANAQVNEIADKITKMSDANKQKLLKLLLK